MEKQFVTYEIALALKELGFDEECLAYYAKPTTKEDIELFFTSGVYGWVKQNNTILQKCTTPLWQQAIDWFREKAGYNIYLEYNSFRSWWYTIAIQSPTDILATKMGEKSYYKIREQAILKAIELYKNN